MPIFISYSHHDSEFATRLAAQLVKHKARVWIDQWELHIGDSIIDRIQSVIQGASALLVVLSKASVKSEWCKKELSSGLLRELEEKRVIVLPVVVEDCEIPLFLRDKLYADFRIDFDRGLKSVLEAIARVTSETLGRHEQHESIIDWAIDSGMEDGFFYIHVIFLEQAKDQPYSLLTELHIVANGAGTARHLKFAEHGLDWIEQAAIIDILVEGTYDKDLRFLLEDERPKTSEIVIGDQKLGIRYHVFIIARRLGADTGRDILLDLGGQLQAIRKDQLQSLRVPTPDEQKKFKEIQASLNQ